MKKKDNYNILILNNFLFFTMFPVVRLYSQRTHLYVKHTHLSMVLVMRTKLHGKKTTEDMSSIPNGNCHGSL